MRIGYARVSTTDQDVSIQIAALTAAGCEVIRSEKKSGTTTEGRTELEIVLSFLRQDDELVVIRLDRLARSVADLQQIVKTLRERGATLRTTDGMVFDNSAVGTVILNVLAAFAAFENDLRRERQREGIEKAKARGIYRGRPFTIDAAKVQALKEQGCGPAEIARKLGISRASVYRICAPAPVVAPAVGA
jgi:DNA invertase Pin-like site-specific DNA recombinase